MENNRVNIKGILVARNNGVGTHYLLGAVSYDVSLQAEVTDPKEEERERVKSKSEEDKSVASKRRYDGSRQENSLRTVR